MTLCQGAVITSRWRRWTPEPQLFEQLLQKFQSPCPRLEASTNSLVTSCNSASQISRRIYFASDFSMIQPCEETSCCDQILLDPTACFREFYQWTQFCLKSNFAIDLVNFLAHATCLEWSKDLMWAWLGCQTIEFCVRGCDTIDQSRTVVKWYE